MPVFYDDNKKLISDDRFIAAGRFFKSFKPLSTDDVILMPEDTILFHLPQRKPIVFDKNLQPIALKDRVPVAAFIPPGYTTTLLASYIKAEQSNIILPLFSYTAVGVYKDKLYVAAIHIDKDKRHKISSYKEREVIKRGEALLKLFPKNRLLRHLIEKCAFEYRCPNAKNLIMNKYEAPLPVSPKCNSQCLGCISYQSKNSKVPPTQQRLDFVPTEEELFEISEYHIKNTKNPILSFGQGCEGEPLLQAKLIANVITKIKQRHKNVTININTNGSNPHALKYLFECGLDSARISLNSAQEELYVRYYKPVNYSFSDVVRSMAFGRTLKKWISVNYFVFPGITDSIEEYRSIRKIIKLCKPSMIQLRNFNIDPDWYIETLNIDKLSKCIGIKNLIDVLKKEFSYLRFGYFNPYLK